ncbi:flavin reductase family protein [Ensifer adhaerens]|uniref:flavin reductase family protein n=1 Tax=Ensifer adhaerens TaxID=106592 RepID=UPI000CF083F5|nr:flavin reductase family protein [Ensifer adhaerens]
MVEKDEGTPLPEATVKAVFGQIATAVTVVTAGRGSERYGATIGTLGALSLDPPLLMFALKQDSSLLQRLAAGSPIGINLLASGQQDIARRFATAGIDRFAMTRWCEEHGLPRVDDALVWAVARVRDRLALGDHVVITTRIDHVETRTGSPLIYWQRQFASLA